MKLWLDDLRPPHLHGCIGWTWAKTAASAIALLSTGSVTEASLDHDLSIPATMGTPGPNEETGYTVLCWLESHPTYWPREGIRVHSQNPSGRARMQAVIDRHRDTHGDTHGAARIAAEFSS